MVEFVQPITQETKEAILKFFNKTPSSFKSDIEALKEWYLRQEHLPRIKLTDQVLMKYICLAKGSVEIAKQQIDFALSVRTLYPNLYEHVHPFDPRCVEARKTCTMIILPKLTKELSRVNIYRLKKGEEVLDTLGLFGCVYNLVQLRFLEESCIADDAIFDCQNSSLKKVLSISPSALFQVRNISQRIKQAKVNHLHIVNPPSFVDHILRVLKAFLKPKVAERILVHTTLESLHSKIEKRVLPKDYGGEEKSIAELEEIMEAKFLEYKDYFDELREAKTREDLRPEQSINDDSGGYQGNFKKLEVD